MSNAAVAAPDKPDRSAIAWMARNSVASNLLMIVIVVAGLILGLLPREAGGVPHLRPRHRQRCTVPYPGASPSEVEQGIVLAVEEELRGLDGVKRVTSTSHPRAIGQVRAELLLGVDKEN